MPSPLYDPGERPDLPFVQRVYGHYHDKVWQDARHLWSEIDSYILRTYQVWDAAQYPKRPQTRTSTGAARVMHAVNNLMASNPKIHCEPAGEGQRHKDKAEAKEKGLSAVLVNANLQESQPPYRQFAFNLVRYDYSVVMGPLLKLQLPTPKPKKRRNEDPDDFTQRMEAWEAGKELYNPIRISVPHPSTVLMDPNERNPMFSVMTTTRPAWQIRQLCDRKALTREGVYLLDVEGKEFQDMDLREFWTPYWHWVGIDDQELYVEENGPGFLPFKHTWGGRGGEFTDDRTVNTAHLGMGLLTPILDDLLRESQEISAQHNVLVEMAHPKVQVPPNADTAEAAQAFDNDFIPQGFAYMKGPEMAAGLANLENRTAQKIEEGTFVMVTAGVKQSETVGQEALLSNAAMRGFEMPRAMMEQTFSLLAADVLRLAHYHGDPIRCRGETLDPADFEGLYQADVTFPTVDPILRMQEREITAKEVGAHLSSRRMFLKAKGVENEEEELNEIDADQAKENPAYHATILAAAYRKDGLDQLSERYEQMAADLVDKQRQELGLDAAQPAAPAGLADLAKGSPIQAGGAASLRRAAPGPAQAGAMANGQTQQGMGGLYGG